MAPLRKRLTACVVCALAAATVHAQPEPRPERPATFIVPYSPGTSADVLARLIGVKLAERSGLRVVTDNRAGASGIIGTEAVAKAAPDGQTLLFTATSHGTLPAVRARLPYDPIRSFAPVILLATSAMGLVASPGLPATTLTQFVDMARARPGSLDYSTPGSGTTQHLAMELFMQEAGLRMVHVPYKGAAGALTDVIAGHVQSSVAALQTAAPHIQKGQLRMLAVMSEERSPAFPQVPTLRELGYPELVIDTWYGVLAPTGTPAEIVARLNTDIDAILTLPDVREALGRQGLSPAGGRPERLRDLLAREIPRWRRVVAAAKLVIE